MTASKLVVAAILVPLLGTAASAQWITRSQGGAFDDGAMHIALTAKGRYGLGLRCQPGEIKIVFMTPEKVDDSSTISIMNAAGPKLRLRVDKGEILELDATVDDVEEKLLVVADGDLDLFKKIRDAKSSVSTVVTVLGQNFHETTFNARGGGKAITKLIKDCDLE